MENHLLSFFHKDICSVVFEIEVLFPLSRRFDVKLLEEGGIISIGASLEKVLKHVVLGVHFHRLIHR